MDKRYTKLLRTLNENKAGRPVYYSVDLNHQILKVHDSKEAGMKYMVGGDGPDGHFLVKTISKAQGKKQVGRFVGRRVSRHLDKQPFPHDDGPHYSVHKESVERAKNVARGMGVDVDNVIRGMGKGPHAEKDKARAAKEQKPTLKSRAKNVARGMGVDPDNVMRGMGFKESVLPSSITPPLAPKEDRDRSDRVRDHELAKRHHERQMTRDPENKKYHLQQASLHSAAEDAGAEVSRIAPGKLRDAANRDFEVKSKKALGESVNVYDANYDAENHSDGSMSVKKIQGKPRLIMKSWHKEKDGLSFAKKHGYKVKNFTKTFSGTRMDIHNMNESVEVNEAHTMVCKDCGDELNKPTTDCANDCSDPNGSHWVKEYMNETSDAAAASWADSRKKLNKGLKQAVKTRDLALQIDKKIAQSRKVRNEEMSDEVKARVASLRNTPSQIAARKAAAKNKMVRPGTEADLPKDHDWNDRDAYPKESTEVDELAQMVPNRNFVKPKDKEKMDQLSKDLDKLRGNLNRGPNDVITEEELEEAGWTPMMRRAAARRMKILAPRIKLGIKRSKNRTATKEKLMNRAVKSVKAALIKKFTRGERKVDLTPARRAEMEKRLKRLGPRIKQLALKQVPATRKMERDRKKNKAK